MQGGFQACQPFRSPSAYAFSTYLLRRCGSAACSNPCSLDVKQVQPRRRMSQLLSLARSSLQRSRQLFVAVLPKGWSKELLWSGVGRPCRLTGR